MSIFDDLERHNIRLRRRTTGNHKITCPECSASRRKKKDPCLSVTVKADGAVWKCHHCDWKGCVKDDDGEVKRRG